LNNQEQKMILQTYSDIVPTYMFGKKEYKVNTEIVSDDYEVSDILISQIKDGFISHENLLGYGIIKSSILYDYDIGYLQYLDSNIQNLISKCRNTSKDINQELNYNFMINGVIGLNDYEIICRRFLPIIQEFYQTDKNLVMKRNYGVIYSNNKNKYTETHTKQCDIVFNICLYNGLNINDMHGSLCYYTSQPSIFSRLKKNIRVNFHVGTGDIIIHQGNQPSQVFNLNPTATGYRTHLIIECDFV
jgi:hypothetical protein